MDIRETQDGLLEEWSADELARAMAENAVVVIDVRTPQEFSFERIAGALLAPMQEFDPVRMPSGGDRRVVFHCASGVRSARMAEACLRSGATRVAHLKGGFAAWKAAGKPFIGTDPVTGGPKPVNTS